MVKKPASAKRKSTTKSKTPSQRSTIKTTARRPVQKAPLELLPAPSYPFEIQVENPDLEVRDGEEVAYGWSVWAAQDDGYESPTLYPAELDGKRVQGIRAEHRYDVCLLQKVKVPLGLSVTFSLNFRVDPTGSDKRERPAGMVVGLGLDPKAGNDPRAESVRWALRDLPYSRTIQASITADAPQAQLTVFVRSIAFIPGSTTIASGMLGEGCVGICGQTPFHRTYLLMPPAPSGSQTNWNALCKKAALKARMQRWTMGYSADDAGIGDALLTPQPVVKALNASAWGSNPPLETWFARNYSNMSFKAITEADLDRLPG